MSTPWLIVSPHCDDAAMSCGALLAMHPGSTVVTVFAGSPAAYEPFTEWDRASGFKPGDDVMALRREEDRRALAILNARPVWLPFLDSQYRAAPRLEAIEQAIEVELVLHAPRAVALPLGLFHSDHVLAREAALRVAGRHSGCGWWVYADALYRSLPGVVDAAVDKLRARGYGLVDVVASTSAAAEALKREAVQCYRSQIRALATPGRLGHLDAHAPERRMALTIPGFRE